MAFSQCQPAIFPSFHVLTAGIVPGSQTSARGEMFAMLRAVQACHNLPPMCHAYFVTDAKYVHDLIHMIEVQHPYVPPADVSNLDIVQQIIPLWRIGFFHIRKVKSHRTFESAEDYDDLYDIVGNHCADMAVTAVLGHATKQIRQLSNEIRAAHILEQKRLSLVCQYMVALNRSKLMQMNELPAESSHNHASNSMTDMAPDPEPVGLVMPKHAMGLDALNFLKTFKPESYVSHCAETVPDHDRLQACQQGANMAMAVISWCKLLTWPPETTPKYSVPSDWGVSWLELFVDFCVCTHKMFDIRIDGLTKNSQYVEYMSPDALLLPKQKRSIAAQAFSLQKIISNLQSILEIDLMPRFNSKKCSSLNRLSTQGKTTGIPCRPGLGSPNVTMKIVHKYLQLSGNSLALGHPIPVDDVLANPKIVDCDTIEELPIAARHQKYLKIMKQISRKKRQRTDV
eukprot:Skav221894  [mRNA]  locus=scaffold1395:670724:672088:+ [translate_table: standard]